MKNKKRLFLTLAVSAVMAFGAVGFSACGNNSDDEKTHEHTYATSWSGDDENHWHAPTCGDTTVPSDKGEHIDEDDNEKCDICDYQLPHRHKYSDQWSSDENYHWYASTCGHTSEVKDKAEHIDEDENKKCDICGYEFHEHKYAEEWTRTENEHWHAPTCGDTTVPADKGEHIDEDDNEKCDICDYQLPHRHRYSKEWSSNQANHWHDPICGDTEEPADNAPHIDENEDYKCDVCGYDLPVPSTKTELGTVNIAAGETTSVSVVSVKSGFYTIKAKLTTKLETGRFQAKIGESGYLSELAYFETDETYTGFIRIDEDAEKTMIMLAIDEAVEGEVWLETYEMPTLKPDGSKIVVPLSEFINVTTTGVDYTTGKEYKALLDPSVTVGKYRISGAPLTGIDTASSVRACFNKNLDGHRGSLRKSIGYVDLEMTATAYNEDGDNYFFLVCSISNQQYLRIIPYEVSLVPFTE